MVTHNPPTISIACSNGPERMKDTANNIKSGNGFTVNIISEPFAEQANVCSINAPENIGEWPISGLTKERSVCLSI
jgi:flavin reductase (DIM6/NTAB) family NADH-FMN oxidoreductase RutF